MLEANKQELDNIMNRFNNDAGGLQAKKDEDRALQDQFMNEFNRLKKEVIWPTIVDVGNQLNQYSHDFHVSEEEEYVDATANFQPASITLNIYPATFDRALLKDEGTPYISFVANRYARKIGINVSTMMPGEGGVVGSHGEYDPNQITKELVEKEILEVLKNTLFIHSTNK
jgi:hypothetical protein